ncbi:hypothetical protein D0T50_01590 [Bacteroides sp. 214]|uniref:hypothetical protein n=1 Tax=Bacteroides sp. 214 TaxID=2302935 RepID=UPI0013D71DB9|nr:hypothetical protein [Bacteroides sp. 214]NDW11578.1 hypothetical protein [Bacteroides sp. 214]
MNKRILLAKSDKLTLNDITKAKEEALIKIRAQQMVIIERGNDVIAPFVQNSFNPLSLFKRFNTGMALFDGVMIGYRIFKKIRNIF